MTAADPRVAVLAQLAARLVETAREVAGSAPEEHEGARRLAVLAELLGGSLAPALDGDADAAADALQVAHAAAGPAAEAVLPAVVLRTAVAAAAALTAGVVPIGTAERRRQRGTG